MISMTKEETIGAIQQYNSLKDRIFKIAERCAVMRKIGDENDFYNEFDVYDDEAIEVQMTTRGCGDRIYIDFPTSYLWQQDWEKQELEAVKNEEEVKRKRAEKLRWAEEKKKEENELAMYLKLKEKFDKVKGESNESRNVRSS